MSRTSPYQPSLLRFLHNVNAVIVLFALVSGYWVYNTFDARFGRIALPRVNSIIDIHGTIGLVFFLFVPLFVIYSVWLGRKRLVQKETMKNLDRAIAWHRIANTAMIGAIALAWISGKLMDETWLPRGELMHLPYLLHLLSWAILIVCLVLHVSMSVKAGGFSLLKSIISVKVRADDQPKMWLKQLRNRL